MDATYESLLINEVSIIGCNWLLEIPGLRIVRPNVFIFC